MVRADGPKHTRDREACSSRGLPASAAIHTLHASIRFGGGMSEQPAGGDALYRSIAAARPRLVCGVPDGMLAETIRLCAKSPDFPYVACAREEECFGLASGAAMAGERAVVLVQNAGLLNSLGAFATMALRYQLPFVVFVTNRGVLADPNGYDIEKCMAFDASVPPLTPVFRFDASRLPDDVAPTAFKWAEAARRPAVIALEKRL
jgi:sulfopyruvate decarboxylase subunit alpha